MKRTLFIMGLAALTLASCSEDEPVEVNTGRAIDFRPAMGILSRATETTNANLSSINVAGFLGSQLFFGDLEFSKGSDGYFTSTPEYRWPGDDSELTFYAFSPSNPGGTVTLTADTKTMTDFTTAATMADQVDFITATATGKKSVNEASGVELTFDHRMSQIEVLAKADNAAYVFTISGVRIGEPVSTGSFDFTSTDWTLGTEKAIYDETYATGVELTSTPTSVMGEGGNAILLPQQLVAWDPEGDATNTAQGAYISVKLQVKTVAGAQVYPFPSDADCMWAAIPIDTNWEAGKKYVYTLDLSNGAGYVDPHDPKPGDPVLGGPIKFTVDVTEWTESTQDLPMETK